MAGAEVQGGEMDADLVRLDRQLCFLLYAGTRAMTRAYQPMLRELQLTYPQYLVLMVLWEWAGVPPAGPSVSALGRRLRLDSGTLTPLLKRQEQQGLVSRVRDPADERRILIVATAAGLALEGRAAQWLQCARQSTAARRECATVAEGADRTAGMAAALRNGRVR